MNVVPMSTPLEDYEVSLMKGAGSDAMEWAWLLQNGRVFVDLLQRGKIKEATALNEELNNREYTLTSDCEFSSTLAEALGGYCDDEEWLFGEAADAARKRDEEAKALTKRDLGKEVVVTDQPEPVWWSPREPAEAAELERIRNALNDETQECAAYTSDAIYVVQRCQRLYGFDTDYVDDIVWICPNSDYIEATEEQAALLNAVYEEDGIDVPELQAKFHAMREGEGLDDHEMSLTTWYAEWQRTAYKDIWEFEQPFLTREAAEDYLERQAHNLGPRARVYVASGHRNPEWKFLRRFIAQVKP